MAAIAGLAVGLGGCRNKEDASPSQTQSAAKAPPPLTPELTAAEKTLESMKEQTLLERERDAADRRELVIPAQPGFQPKA